MFLFWVKHLHTYSNIVINFQVKELREKRNRLSFIKYVYVNNHPFKSLMSTLFLNPITLKDRNYSNSLNTANNHCRFWDALGVVATTFSSGCICGSRSLSPAPTSSSNAPATTDCISKLPHSAGACFSSCADVVPSVRNRLLAVHSAPGQLHSQLLGVT